MDSSIEVLNSELAKRFNAPVKSERKYVSMFRIDGKPILPPVMTPSKIAAMRKLREQAIEIEKYLEAKRQKKLGLNSAYEENSPTKAAAYERKVMTSPDGAEKNENIASITKSSEVKDSLVRLSNFMQNYYDDTHKYEQSKPLDGLQSEWPTGVTLPRSTDRERIQKLKKSETLIYDNFSHVSTTPAKDWELEKPQPGKTQQLISAFNQQSKNDQRKTLNLPLENVMQIPSICVNPPTPLGDTQGFHHDVQSETQQQSFSDKSDCSLGESSNYSIIDCDSTDSNSRVDVRNPPKRSATSPALKQQAPQSPSPSSLSPQSSENGLVRSSSFTLEYPSKALIEHMRQQKASGQKRCVPTTSAMRDTVESKAKRVQKVESRPRVPTPRLSNQKPPKTTSRFDPAKVYGNSSILTKSRPSPYDSKIKKPARAPKKVALTPKKPAVKSSPPNSTICSTPKDTGKDSGIASSGTPQMLKKKNQCTAVTRDLITEIEAEHREKLLMLMAQQVEEQKRLEQSFVEQKNELLAKLLQKMQIQSPKRPLNDLNVDLNLTVTPMGTPRSQAAPKAPVPNVANTMAPLSAVCLETSTATATGTNLPHADFCTPRRRLFSNESSCSSYGTKAISERVAKRPVAMPVTANRRNEQDQQVRDHAATKINALARGFLVRRLFQTEQIQRIVQTIRDTLIFVINLHMETSENAEEANTPANIKLKARLLQQLSSATRTLHLFFFQTSIKERMEIIARDRKRIKTKLLTMNRKLR